MKRDGGRAALAVSTRSLAGPTGGSSRLREARAPVTLAARPMLSLPPLRLCVHTDSEHDSGLSFSRRAGPLPAFRPPRPHPVLCPGLSPATINPFGEADHLWPPESN